MDRPRGSGNTTDENRRGISRSHRSERSRRLNIERLQKYLIKRNNSLHVTNIKWTIQNTGYRSRFNNEPSSSHHHEHNRINTPPSHVGNVKKSLDEVKLVGYFSIDGNQRYVQDVSEIRYLTIDEGKVDINLERSFDTDINHENTKGIAHHAYFEYLNTHKHLLDEMKNDDFNENGIITNRRCLINAMKTNFETIYIAFVIRNNIYLTNAHGVEKDTSSLPTKQGHLFEYSVLSVSPDEKPNPDGPINEFRSFNAIYEGRLNKHRLLYKCEIDGILANSECECEMVPTDLSEEETVEELKKRRFIELKLIRYNHYKYNHHITKYIWTQSILNNTDDIYIGNRSEQNYNKVDKIVKTNLYDLVKAGIQWSPETHLNKLDNFLTFVKECLGAKVKNSTPIIRAYVRIDKDGAFEEMDRLPEGYVADYIPEWYFDKQ